MAKILITSLGTGGYTENKGYRQTTYKFPDGKAYESSLFMAALLKHEPQVNKVILIGTVTSGWDMLVENDDALWEKVVQTTSQGGLPKDLETPIAEALDRHYTETSFILKIHTDTLDANTAEDVLAVYNSIQDEIKPGDEVIFDITHGFRSMPLLVYQALQLDAEKMAGVKTSIVYGEYVASDRISYVRDLTSYWDYAEIAKAKMAFIERFDGRRIADELEADWDRGAKVVRRISGIVACNFSLQIPDCLKEVRNALNAFPDTTKQWMLDIRNNLQALYERLTQKSEARCVFEFAKLLKEKRLYTQAVIALQVTVETAITERYGTPEDKGDYDWWLDVGRGYLKDTRRELSQKQSDNLYRLEQVRNQIAHGGSRNSYGGGGFPNAENLPATLERVIPAVESLLAVLEK